MQPTIPRIGLGDRLVVGRQTLDLSTEVRILVPQPSLFHPSGLPGFLEFLTVGVGVLPRPRA